MPRGENAHKGQQGFQQVLHSPSAPTAAPDLPSPRPALGQEPTDTTSPALEAWEAFQRAQNTDRPHLTKEQAQEAETIAAWLADLSHDRSDVSGIACACPMCEPSDNMSPAITEGIRLYRAALDRGDSALFSDEW